jgi:hypothetical protein
MARETQYAEAHPTIIWDIPGVSPLRSERDQTP